MKYRHILIVIIILITIILHIQHVKSEVNKNSDIIRFSTPVEYPSESKVKVPSGFAVADNGDTIVVMGKYPARLYMIDGKTGKIRWRYNNPRDMIGGADISPSGDRVVLKDIRADIEKIRVISEDMVMLNAQGKQVWRRKAPGIARFSSTGKHILTMMPAEADFGIRIYRASDGALLWGRTPAEIGSLDNAMFSADGNYVLAHIQDKLILFTISGKRVWLYPVWAKSVSVSADGSRVALLTGGQTTKLTVLGRNGQVISDTVLIQYNKTGPPDPNLGSWSYAEISRDGSFIFMEGVNNGARHLQMMSPYGKVLWNKTLPGSATVPSFHIMRDNQIVQFSHVGDNLVIRFLNKEDDITAETKVPYGKEIMWTASPGDKILSVLAGNRVLSVKAP